DDARFALVIAQKMQQLVARIVLVLDAIADVGTVETRNEAPRRFESQAGDDLLARLRVRGGGQGDARHAREAFVEYRQLQVFGAEVVPPLRYTMRLVNREQGEALLVAQAFEQSQRA